MAAISCSWPPADRAMSAHAACRTPTYSCLQQEHAVGPGWGWGGRGEMWPVPVYSFCREVRAQRRWAHAATCLQHWPDDISYQIILTDSVVTVIEIGTETAVFQQNRTELKPRFCLSVDGFANGAALALPWTLTACRDASRRTCYRRDRRRSAAVMHSTTSTCDGGGEAWNIWMDGEWGLGKADGPSETN